MAKAQPFADPDARAVAYSRHAALAPLAEVLAEHRDEVLERWLKADCSQPFHQGRPDPHVADHIPPLLDALIELLRRSGQPEEPAQAPLEDPAVLQSAAAHAHARAEVGLTAPEIVTEFRLLRQEIWRALRFNIPPRTALSDVLAAEMLINDGLDGAIRMSLDLHRRDVEQASAEADRRRQQQEAILEGVTDGIVAQASGGRVLWANRPAARLLGFDSPEALLAASREEIAAVFELLDESGAPVPIEQLPSQRALRGEEAPEQLLRLHRKTGGSDSWLVIKSRPIADEQGDVDLAITMMADVTDRVEQEHQKEELLAAVAHDLKTPLTSAKGYVQLLQRWTAGQEARVEGALGKVSAANDRMMRLLDEFLDTALLASNQPLELSLSEVDLSELLTCVAGEMPSSARIQLHAEGGPLTGTWDRQRLQRVLENLMSNALKFSPPHTMVDVAATREGDMAVVRVADQGMGIPEAEQARIFERFHRAPNAVGRVPGTGLGLAYSCHVVQQLGGEISVDSREGAGSTFTLRLPLAGE